VVTWAAKAVQAVKAGKFEDRYENALVNLMDALARS
jgi:hypothetical protein